MKDETYTFELMEEILKLSVLNPRNRIMVLQWCDALRSSPKERSIIQSEALDPYSVQLEYEVGSSTVRLKSQATMLMKEIVPPHLLPQFVATVISGIEQTILNLDELPKRLRRLIAWQRVPSSQSTPITTALPTDVARARKVFYSAVWQHFQAEPFSIRRSHASILLLSRTKTLRLSMRSGRVLRQYEGHCVDDNLHRLYRVTDDLISQIDSSGDPRWSAAVELKALPHGLHAFKNRLIIAEPGRLTSLNAHSGRKLWQMKTSVLTLRTIGDWLYTIDTSDGVVVHRRHYSSQSPIEVLTQPGTLIKYWWLNDYLIICPTLRNDERCTHVIFIELSTGTSHKMRIPPTRPLCASASSSSIALLVRSFEEHRLLSFDTTNHSVRLLTIQLPHLPRQIVHHARNALILWCSDNRLVSICPDTLSVIWNREINSELPVLMEHALMHQGLIIVPGGPVRIIDSGSGRTLSAIDDPLYADARPLLVDQRRLLLHDEAGYLGQFEVQGHIGVSYSNPEV